MTSLTSYVCSYCYEAIARYSNLVVLLYYLKSFHIKIWSTFGYKLGKNLDYSGTCILWTPWDQQKVS